MGVGGLRWAFVGSELCSPFQGQFNNCTKISSLNFHGHT